MTGRTIKEKIQAAIEKFNKYRSPEAVAKLLSFAEKSKTLKIEFTGSFCRSCGFHDYFDDFKIEMENVDLKVEIRKIKETEQGGVVEFAIVVGKN